MVLLRIQPLGGPYHCVDSTGSFDESRLARLVGKPTKPKSLATRFVFPFTEARTPTVGVSKPQENARSSEVRRAEWIVAE